MFENLLNWAKAHKKETAIIAIVIIIIVVMVLNRKSTPSEASPA